METVSLSSNDLAKATSDASKPLTSRHDSFHHVSAVQDFGAQSSTRNVVMVAAKSAACQGMACASSGLGEARKYAQQNPDSVRVISFGIALALLVFSFLGVINVFNAVFKPHQYLFALYNVVFAAVIIVADGNPEWFAKCGDLQGKLFSAAGFLASQSGRAAFYFYVGSINLFMLPDNWLWKFIYVGLGGALCFNGTLMLLDSAFCQKRHQMDEPLCEGP